MSRKNKGIRTRKERREKHGREEEKARQEGARKILTVVRNFDWCEELQERMRRQCDLVGRPYESIGSSLLFRLESGKKVTIFGRPKTLSIFGMGTKLLYGTIEAPKGRLSHRKYIMERLAIYLFDRLGENIRELQTKQNTI